jgi:hypothetical protein
MRAFGAPLSLGSMDLFPVYDFRLGYPPGTAILAVRVIPETPACRFFALLPYAFSLPF